jgi:PAP_fibrillin
MKVSTTAIALSLSGVSLAAFADDARVADLKSQVETRARIEPLAKELAALHAPANAQADLPALEGAWKEIFSDDVEPEPPGFSTDRDGVYQVITTQGYFYNFGNLKGPGPLRLLGVLRGKYTPEADFLNIEFTKVSIRPNALREGEILTDVVEKIEAGSTFTFVPPGGNRAPNGPVGANGNIKNLYIDEDFRIATGSNFADGKYDIYVLDKVTTPVTYKIP